MRELESEVENEQRRGTDAIKGVRKYERRVKELTYQVSRAFFSILLVQLSDAKLQIKHFNHEFTFTAD